MERYISVLVSRQSYQLLLIGGVFAAKLYLQSVVSTSDGVSRNVVFNSKALSTGWTIRALGALPCVRYAGEFPFDSEALIFIVNIISGSASSHFICFFSRPAQS